MCLKPYYCSAHKLTIGVGRNLEDNPLSVEERKAVGDYRRGITENAAKMLLRNDICRTYESLKRLVKNFTELDGERQYALVDMCFQLGVHGFKGFKRMIKEIEQQNFVMAAYECLHSQYAKQVPVRAKRIAYTIKFGRFPV